jgi:hypothetical protein
MIETAAASSAVGTDQLGTVRLSHGGRKRRNPISQVAQGLGRSTRRHITQKLSDLGFERPVIALCVFLKSLHHFVLRVANGQRRHFHHPLALYFCKPSPLLTVGARTTAHES